VDWFLRGMIEVERKHLVDLGVMEFWSSGLAGFGLGNKIGVRFDVSCRWLAMLSDSCEFIA
jgi:hypothetical protein